MFLVNFTFIKVLSSKTIIINVVSRSQYPNHRLGPVSHYQYAGDPLPFCGLLELLDVSSPALDTLANCLHSIATIRDQ